ncbi:hypothetical protein [Sphingomonas sp.]|jgi:hypothetical protein|uniref:hypothetical protein n=1 Tax=Sphingomonas sp. TaxID=28214 RepID=UPI002D7F2F82|nr:hypothetical protein [Sphingomonas sp.]HEU0043481.1 hypothetical protein [Sphingomonas sp.]
MNRRRLGFVVAALVLVAVSARQPTANIQVLTHDATDVDPQRVQAAVDLGLIGVKLLYTWTSRQLR